MFLDDFYARNEPAIRTKEVQFASAVGPVHGFWARADRSQPLPAVLLAYGGNALTAWMQTNARHLASIGYTVLAVKLRPMAGKPSIDEAALAELSAAVRWLRGRSDVLPNRLGVVGWGRSGTQVLALAGSAGVQACVVCDTPLPGDDALILGLRGTAVLGVFGEKALPDERDLLTLALRLKASDTTCRFHVGPGAQVGFLGPPGSRTYNHDAAEDAWVAIYNFLEKHVEDARPAKAVARPVKSALTIADMMRAVNEPTGVRGALSRALETPPKTARQWGHVRAQAALVAEMGAWLQAQTPPKGPASHWQAQAQAYTKAAAAIVEAAERRNHAAAQQGLTRLAGQCAACHNEHR